MSNTKSQFLIRAAVAGIIGASALSLSTAAMAADEAGAKGHCMGANACKGKGGCKQEGKNECKTQNGCNKKGFLETTKAKCDEFIAKDKLVKFVPVK